MLISKLQLLRDIDGEIQLGQKVQLIGKVTIIGQLYSMSSYMVNIGIPCISES